MSEVPAEKSIKQREQLEAYSESKESEPKAVHNMNEKQQLMYELFLQERAAHRAKNNEEDIAARNMFIELGRKAFDEQMAAQQGALQKVNNTF
jgi:hypothetical protein